MKTPAKKDSKTLLQAAHAFMEKRKPKLFALLGTPGSDPRIVGCREIERYEGMKSACVREVLPGGQETDRIHFLPYAQIATQETLAAKTAEFRAAAASRPPLSAMAGKTDATAA